MRPNAIMKHIAEQVAGPRRYLMHMELYPSYKAIYSVFLCKLLSVRFYTRDNSSVPCSGSRKLLPDQNASHHRTRRSGCYRLRLSLGLICWAEEPAKHSQRKLLRWFRILDQSSFWGRPTLPLERPDISLPQTPDPGKARHQKPGLIRNISRRTVNGKSSIY